MVRDLILEVELKDGAAVFSPFLSSFLIKLDIEIDSNGVSYLRQSKGSPIAGIYLNEINGFIHDYGISFELSDEEAKNLVKSISELCKSAKARHRIYEIYHEVDFNEELVSYNW